MPIGLDTRGIVRSDRVNELDGFWKRHPDLLHAPLDLVTPPDLEMGKVAVDVALTALRPHLDRAQPNDRAKALGLD